jgi:hypothetical protein
VIATLLVTDKMSPALRARVEASVRGHRRTPGRRGAPSLMGLLRLSLVVCFVLLISTFVMARRRAAAELETDRANLLERFRREAAGLTSEQRTIGERVQGLLEQAAGPYTGDAVTAELRSAAALAGALARPTVYVRGPVQSFTRLSGVRESAAASFGDAFVLCLLDPPSTRTEKLLLSRARSALSGGERVERAAPHVSRLYHALAGLPYLSPPWEARVKAAEKARELELLRRDFERAPLKGAKAAAQAELLLYAMDEPGDRSVPAELDGERPHHVRVGLVDLSSRKQLLALRRKVDPSWLSPTARAEYASGIDACSLALDVRAEVTGQKLGG